MFSDQQAKSHRRAGDSERNERRDVSRSKVTSDERWRNSYGRSRCPRGRSGEENLANKTETEARGCRTGLDRTGGSLSVARSCVFRPRRRIDRTRNRVRWPSYLPPSIRFRMHRGNDNRMSENETSLIALERARRRCAGGLNQEIEKYRFSYVNCERLGQNG